MKAVTVRTLRQMKFRPTQAGAGPEGHRPITMLTCYDATFARLLDEAGVDMLLVGDSLGMVIKGDDDTLDVSVEEVAYHVKAVARGSKRAHIVGDLPFMSYQVSVEDALRNAGTLIKAGAHSVKLEGGVHVAETVKRMVAAGIPVVGHIGLVPQSVNAMGGFVVQGRDDESRARILEDARALCEAGAFCIVLEGIPSELAAEITSSVDVPTIGIGAGNACDGQVLVLYDLLGLNPGFKPKFVKHFVPGASVVTDAVRGYIDEVRERTFPDEAHSFSSESPRKGRLKVAGGGA